MNRKLPIRTIDPSNPQDKSDHDKIISLVSPMLDLNKRLSHARTPDEKTILQRQIDATEKMIDSLVYELYGLSGEIRIVESNA